MTEIGYMPHEPPRLEPVNSQHRALGQTDGIRAEDREGITNLSSIASHQSEFLADFYANPGRRIQPQRQRRGEFGSHEYDNVIQEAMDNLAQQQAFLPADTRVFCTTNSKALPNVEALVELIDRNIGLSKEIEEGAKVDESFVNHGYFKNEEVRMRVKGQKAIETPMFERLTEEHVRRAMEKIPGHLLEEPVDYSDEAYIARYAAGKRTEARIRVSEKEKYNHGRYQLEARVEQLKGLDASYFRGDTMEEQERHRKLFLDAVPKLLPGGIGNEGEGDFEDDAVAIPQAPLGRANKKTIANNNQSRKKEKLQHSHQPLANDGIQNSVAPPRPEKKKSSRIYFDHDQELEFALQEDISENEVFGKKKKKAVAGASKKGSSLGKRKRVEGPPDEFAYKPYLDQEGDHDEYVEQGRYKPPPKKLKAAYKRAPSVGTPGPRIARATLRPGMLLEQARKYNPIRESRDVAPFGAAFSSRIATSSIDFELPVSVTDGIELDNAIEGREIHEESEGEEREEGEREVVDAPSEIRDVDVKEEHIEDAQSANEKCNEGDNVGSETMERDEHGMEEAMTVVDGSLGHVSGFNNGEDSSPLSWGGDEEEEEGEAEG